MKDLMSLEVQNESAHHEEKKMAFFPDDFELRSPVIQK